MPVEINTRHTDEVTVSVVVDLEDLPHAGRGQVIEVHAYARMDPQPEHGTVAFDMRIEVLWQEEPNGIKYGTEWLISFETLLECAAYFGAIANRYYYADSTFSYDREV